MIHTDGTPTIANAPALQGFRVRNEGSIFLIEPLDRDAKNWILDNVGPAGPYVDDEPQYFGNALAVEHRYAYDLIDGIFDAGFAVR